MDHFYRDYLIVTGVIKGGQLSGRGRNSLGYDSWNEYAGLMDGLWWIMRIFLAVALPVLVVTYWVQILAGVIILVVALVVVGLFFAYPLAFLLAILLGSIGGD